MMSFNLLNMAGNGDKAEPSTNNQLEIPLKMAGNNVLVSQLLFDKSSKHLAIFCSKSVQVVSLSELKDTKSLPINAPIERQWLAHPDEDGLMIGVAAGSIMILDWQLTGQRVYRFKNPPSHSIQGQPPPRWDAADIAETWRSSSWPTTATPDDGRVIRAVVTRGRRKHLLVQMSLHGSTSRAKLHLAFDMSWFSTSSFALGDVPSSDSNTETPQPQTLTPTHFVPPEIADDVALVLEFLSQDRLVFLSRDFSICIWQVPVESFVAATRNSWLPASSSTRSTLNPPLSSPHPSRIGKRMSLPGDSSRNIMTPAERPRLSVRNQSNENVRWKGDRAATTSVSVSSTTMPRTLFYLPGDWISRISSTSAILWLQEKSLFCPRNGEVEWYDAQL